MHQIHFSRAALIIMIIPLMSLHSGKKKATPLQIIRQDVDRYKNEIILKQAKRKVIEDQINYHDSIRISKCTVDVK